MANRAIIGEKTFAVGDVIKVSQEVLEEGKQRVVNSQGVVMKIRGRGKGKSFTIRWIGSGKIGIERTFPLASPTLRGVEVVKKGKARRAKLYYLRNKK